MPAGNVGVMCHEMWNSVLAQERLEHFRAPPLQWNTFPAPCKPGTTQQAYAPHFSCVVAWISALTVQPAHSRSVSLRQPQPACSACTEPSRVLSSVHIQAVATIVRGMKVRWHPGSTAALWNSGGWRQQCPGSGGKRGGIIQYVIFGTQIGKSKRFSSPHENRGAPPVLGHRTFSALLVEVLDSTRVSGPCGSSY